MVQFVFKEFIQINYDTTFINYCERYLIQKGERKGWENTQFQFILTQFAQSRNEDFRSSFGPLERGWKVSYFARHVDFSSEI